jgi:hypothetical protein
VEVYPLRRAALPDLCGGRAQDQWMEHGPARANPCEGFGTFAKVRWSSMPQPDFVARWKRYLWQLIRTLGEMLYGASVYEMVRDLNKERAHLEHLFILVVFGDLLGIPVLPPYYTLRLLPFVAPNITGWRRTLLRERDITDLCDQEIT